MDSEALHHSQRKGNFLHTITFVVVNAALHSHYVFLPNHAKHKLPFVTTYSRYRKERNRIVWHDNRIAYLFYKFIAQARAQNDANLRTYSMFFEIPCSFG